MNKMKLNYIVNIGLVISFGIVAVTGIMKLPALGGMPRNFMALHDWAGIAFVIFAVLHLIMHWNMMATMTKSFLSKKKK